MLIIYTKPTSLWCKKTKDFLNENLIPFREKDATNPDNQREMIEISGQTSVPVLDIDGEILVGYAPDEILELIKPEEK